MADFVTQKILDFPSVASLPFRVSPHLSFYTVCFSPPRRRSSSPISGNLTSHSNSPSSSLPAPIEIVSTTECSDGSFLFKFGDPSEIFEDVNDSSVSDSDLLEEEGLHGEENKAGSVSKVVNKESIIVDSAEHCSSDVAVLELNAAGIKSVHEAELTVLHTDAVQGDGFDTVSVDVKVKETSATMLETGTDFAEGSNGSQIDDSVTSPEFGVVVDIETNSPFEEEAPEQINAAAADSVYPEVSFGLDLYNKGCDGDELIDIDESRLNVDSLDSLVHASVKVTDDYEVEIRPQHAKLVADLALEEEIGNKLVAAESSVNSVGVDDAACDTVLADERIDSDVEKNVSSNTDVGVEQPDTVARGEEISSPKLALASGVASLTCPSQVLTGLEDAYFVADEKWFIVANSVGQWSFKGMKPGLYAHELIQNLQSLTSNSDSCKENVKQVLKQSASKVQSPGLASVLIARFDDGVLNVANIGDTGFIIIRNGCVHKRSFPIIHDFNLPVQIRSSDDPLRLAEEYQVHLDDGDVIIMATDGLFDNLYEKDIASIVSKSLQEDNMKPKEVADILAAKAQEVGKSAAARCPFADEAEAAGYTGFTGGKLDHVTAIVSLVKKHLSPHE